MKLRITLVIVAVLVMLVAGQALAQGTYSEEHATSSGGGNHGLDCTVIRPWSAGSGPVAGTEYPLIVWANGWGGNSNSGANVTDGYKPGLIEWALDGPYIVVAVNAWSAKASDIFECTDWIVGQNSTAGSEYEGAVNVSRMGFVGHSQGGGAAIKAGNGGRDYDVSAVIGMNPYGPGWKKSGNQDGPVMLLGGTNDSTTPTSSFLEVWDNIQNNGQGGLLADLIGGTHNSEAWGPAGSNPEDHNFGLYQDVTALWWQVYLNDNVAAGSSLRQILDANSWDTQYTNNLSW